MTLRIQRRGRSYNSNSGKIKGQERKSFKGANSDNKEVKEINVQPLTVENPEPLPP